MVRLAIKDLSLSHFRSHKKARIETDGLPVVLFGPNGAGKTNLLEAVSLLSPGRGLRRAKAEELARSPENLGWKISAQTQHPAGLSEIETTAEPGQSRSVRIDGKPTPQIRLAETLRVLWLVPAMDRLWTEAAEGRRRFLDRMVMSMHPDHAAVSLVYEKAMRNRNRMLKDQISDPSWYRSVEHQMAQAGIAVQNRRQQSLVRLSQAQADARTEFPTASLALSPAPDTPEFNSAEDLVRLLADTRPRDQLAGRTLAGPHRMDLSAVYTEKNTDARNCSTGEQKALLISLVLANCRALAADSGAAPVLLLDEVAAHLDANRRAGLFGELADLNVQSWMTGTDPELFDSINTPVLTLEVCEESGLSELRKVTLI